MNVNIPVDELILNNSKSTPPAIWNVISLVLSGSFAAIWPTNVWFSSTVNIAVDVNTGASLTFVIIISIIWSDVNIPSLAWTVNVYDDLIS